MATDEKSGSAGPAFAKLKALVFPRFELRQAQWEERIWTSGDALAQALAECVSEGSLGHPGEVKSWPLWYAGEGYTKNATPGPQTSREADTSDPCSPPERRLGVALALVFCAELALRHREDTQQDLGKLLFSLCNGRDRGCQPSADWFDCQFPGRDPVNREWLRGNRPQTFQTMCQLLAEEDWVWGCIRSLQGAPVLGRSMGPDLCAPVVGVDLEGQAMVHTLVVEVLSCGAGKVFRSPCDVFGTEPVLEAQFAHSMRAAFTTALAEVNRGKPETKRVLDDGRWRLLHGWKWNLADGGKLRPVPAPSGASASGAAARLWWFALSDKVSDDRVVVIAQVNDAGQIVAVDREHIVPKLEAVIQAVITDSKQGWQYFDTVGVVDENLETAQEAVETAVKQGRIREDQLKVVDIAKVKPADPL
jgi:hypothetical protein